LLFPDREIDPATWMTPRLTMGARRAASAATSRPCSGERRRAAPAA
jgi:hypothetical protein